MQKWFGVFGALLLTIALLMAMVSAAIFRSDRERRARGSSPWVAMVALGVCAALLALVGLSFVMTAGSDSFGR